MNPSLSHPLSNEPICLTRLCLQFLWSPRSLLRSYHIFGCCLSKGPVLCLFFWYIISSKYFNLIIIFIYHLRYLEAFLPQNYFEETVFLVSKSIFLSLWYIFICLASGWGYSGDSKRWLKGSFRNMSASCYGDICTGETVCFLQSQTCFWIVSSPSPFICSLSAPHCIKWTGNSEVFTHISTAQF